MYALGPNGALALAGLELGTLARQSVASGEARDGGRHLLRRARARRPLRPLTVGEGVGVAPTNLFASSSPSSPPSSPAFLRELHAPALGRLRLAPTSELLLVGARVLACGELRGAQRAHR